MSSLYGRKGERIIRKLLWTDLGDGLHLARDVGGVVGRYGVPFRRSGVPGGTGLGGDLDFRLRFGVRGLDLRLRFAVRGEGTGWVGLHRAIRRGVRHHRARVRVSLESYRRGHVCRWAISLPITLVIVIGVGQIVAVPVQAICYVFFDAQLVFTEFGVGNIPALLPDVYNVFQA